MAPEQVEGREADARTDVFAFGAVLYEMVTGRRAFGGETQASLVGAILEKQPPPVSTLQPLAPRRSRPRRADVPRQGPRRAVAVGRGPGARTLLDRRARGHVPEGTGAPTGVAALAGAGRAPGAGRSGRSRRRPLAYAAAARASGRALAPRSPTGRGADRPPRPRAHGRHGPAEPDRDRAVARRPTPRVRGTAGRSTAALRARGWTGTRHGLCLGRRERTTRSSPRTARRSASGPGARSAGWRSTAARRSRCARPPDSAGPPGSPRTRSCSPRWRAA